MKKILLTLTAVAGLTFASNAQEFGFEKGNFIVEGSLQASSTNNKNSENKESAFQFTPQAGYFVTDKIAVGIGLGYGRGKETTNTTAVKTVRTDEVFAAGVFGRYYFLDLGSRFKTYTQVNLAYANTTGEEKLGSDPAVKDPALNGFNAGAGVGVNYFLTNKIAVNFALADVISYSTAKYDVDGAKSVNTFNANLNVFDNFFSTAKFGLTFKF